MLVSEDQVAALEAEIAEILGILETLDEEGIAEGMRHYAEQLGRIGLMAGEMGLHGLQDVCRLFDQRLADLSRRGGPLSDPERERLEEWPLLAIAYLGDLHDPAGSEPLIDHLSSPDWATPLAAGAAEAVRGMLTLGTAAAEPDAIATVEAVEELDGALDAVPSFATEPVAETGAAPVMAEPPAPVSMSEPVAATEPVSFPMAAPSPEPVETAALPETTPAIEAAPASVATVMAERVQVEEPFPAMMEAVNDAAPAVGPIAEAAPLVIAETAMPAYAAAAEADEEVADESAAESLEQAEAEQDAEEDAVEEDAEEDAEEDVEAEEAEEDAAAEDAEGDADEDEDEDEEDEDDEDDEEEDEPALVTGVADSAQQELLEILCVEIVQLAEAAAEVLGLAQATESTPAVRAEALSGYAENLERLGDAAASIGLTGLQQVCGCLQANLGALATQQHPLQAEQRELVETWPDLALNYLGALGDRTVCTELVTHLQDVRWPQPLASAAAAPLIEMLAASKLVIEVAETEARPQQARPEDVSLALPADVNQELLDGLLQELPNQAAEFSAAIQHLASGGGTLKEMEVAQRIAHTLKGAGNTVGVRGIATLTHYVEDILQALTKHGALPNRPLAETLLDAADCLENMSEALLGMSAPPTQAMSVLQQVLDWANQIDRTGIPTGDAIPTPAASRAEAAEAAEAAPTEALQSATAAPEVTLRVPAHLVDDVLRLVGESIILTGQIQERIRKTVTQTRAVMGQNRLFQHLTSELEQLIDVRNVSSPLSKSMQRGDFDPLELEQYNELNTVTHRLVEAAVDTRELGRAIEENLASLDALLVDQGRLHRDNQEAVLRTRMVPIQTIVPRLQRSVRQTCRLVDKEADLAVRGADTLIDSNVLNNMVDPLMHILRNAVDHGIESQDQRKHAGKPPLGRIELQILREGNNIVMRCQDDGAGLDLAAVRRTAQERGLITADQVLDEDELSRLILLPGFSTRSATTQTSGRGIGMDVVYTQLLAMKGSLRIQSKTGQGCLIELRLPVTLISTHALLLRVHSQIYALSDRGIEQILYSGVGTIQTLGNVTTYRIGNDVYELETLEALLGLSADRRTQTRSTPPVLLVREETGNVRAVLVQEIMDSRDLVVKRMGQYIPKLNGIVGATILGDGSVVPVLDLPELLRAPAAIQLARTVAPAATLAAATTHRPFVLAVDDSLSARRSLAQFAQDAGFEVRTARDGLEAIEIINGKQPDLVLADLEMPRMNGLELTAHLRANQATHELPVIMITSRSTEKHRREAETAGVNVYLTKPFVEDELLGHIHRLLRPV